MAFKVKQKERAVSSETKILAFALADGWIPACAGMTAVGAGMTAVGAGMTALGAGER